MSEAKHTPDMDIFPDPTKGEVIVGTCNGSIVTAFAVVPFNDMAEGMQRARLIASAPKLLEALQGMLTWARRVKELNPGPEVGQALSAIAEALGKGGDV